MAGLYRLTADGGTQLCRPAALHTIADRIREQPDGRRHVRLNTAPQTVATVDVQRSSIAVFTTGIPVPPRRWPTWALELAQHLSLPVIDPLPQEHP